MSDNEENMKDHLSSEDLLFVPNKSSLMFFLRRTEENWPIEFVSESVSQFLGYTSEELLKEKILYTSIIHPDDVQRVVVEANHFTETRAAEFTQKYRIIAKNGDVRWVNDQTWIKYNSQGQATYYQGFVADITTAKLVNEFSKSNKEKYSGLFENTETCVVVYEAVDNGEDFVIVEFNKAAERVEKISRDDVLGKRVTLVFPGVVEFGLLEVLRRVFETGCSETYPLKFYKDSRIAGWRRYFVYKLTSGEIVSIYDDLSELMILQDQLFKTVQDWEDIFNSISDMITIHDIDYNIINANKAAMEFFGKDFFKLNNKKCFHYFHKKSNPPDDCKAHEVLVNRQPQVFDFFEPELNRYIEVRVVPRIDRYGNLLGVIHIVRDVTNQKFAEAYLEKRLLVERCITQISTRFVCNTNISEVLNQTLADICSIADVSEGHIFQFRDQYRFMDSTYSWRLSDVSMNAYCFKDLSTLEFPWFMKKLQAGETVHIPNIDELPSEAVNEKAFLSKNGVRSLLAFPINVANNLFGFVCLTDITKTGCWQEEDIDLLRGIAEIMGMAIERDTAVKALLKSEQQLFQAQKMESIGLLAGGIAHDFNNLLAIILGNVELLETILSRNRENNEIISSIKGAVQRGNELTAKLLAFGRKQIIKPENIDLNQKISETVKMMRRIIPENIEIKFYPGYRLGMVFVDPVQFEQILLNLAVNSRDAMPNGGEIIIETQNVLIEEDYVKSHPWAKIGRYCLLSFSDTGCGIPAEIQPKIFDPFFTTKEIGKGSGLGLPTVLGIVKQHNGIINVYSEVGKGTTFKIYFPVVERKASEIGTNHHAPIVGGNEGILFAEDDTDLGNLGKKVLTAAGYKVFFAPNGEEAIELLKRHAHEIKLAVIDVVMPKVGGKEIFDFIQANFPSIRVLFTSGYTTNAIHYNGILKSQINLLMKPFTRDTLLSKIREILDASN